jgi:predicted O-methyltransferase YrrM
VKRSPGSTSAARAPFPDRLPPASPDQQEVVIESGSTTKGKGAGPLEGAAVADWIAGWQPEEPPLLAARQRAAEVGVAAVDPGTGAALRFLAAAASAKAVVELGTGAGVSSLWLLSGMQGGILTSVDAESEHQRLAKASLAEAGVPAGRARLIHGRALEVLPRLSDAAYDLLFCDANRAENGDYLNAAVRLLRPGGIVVFAGALGGGRVAEASARDADTVAQREFAKALRDDVRFVAGAVPVGPGLLVAARTASD